MVNTIKIIIACLIAVVAIAAVIPAQSNYYQDVINVIATEHGMQLDGLTMQSGAYQNFMLFQTLTINLASSDHETVIHAVAHKTPLSDWHLSDYNRTVQR